jgi:uncharacterized protein YciI
MPVYAVTYHYLDQPEVLTEHRPAHRAYLESLRGEKGLLAAGRTPGGLVDSALLLFDTDSVEVVERVLDSDPFWTEGLIVKREILEWVIAIGSVGAGER